MPKTTSDLERLASVTMGTSAFLSSLSVCIPIEILPDLKTHQMLDTLVIRVRCPDGPDFEHRSNLMPTRMEGGVRRLILQCQDYIPETFAIERLLNSVPKLEVLEVQINKPHAKFTRHWRTIPQPVSCGKEGSVLQEWCRISEVDSLVHTPTRSTSPPSPLRPRPRLVVSAIEDLHASFFFPF